MIILKNMAKKIVSSLLTIPFRLFGEKTVEFYLQRLCVAYNKTSKNYINFTIYPKTANCMVSPIKFGIPEKKTAIVIQGPIIERDDFTLESIRLYKKLYPETIIILSSWENSNLEAVGRIKRENIQVVLSQIPLYTGVGNINLQVSSTMAGLKQAKENGVQYVLKTRTDQRIHRRNLIEYLQVMINKNPVGHSIKGLVQNKRMVVLQGSTIAASLLVPGYISDFFYFGDIEDIIEYFSIDEQRINQSQLERNKWLKLLRKDSTIKEYFYKSAPEVMLYESYLNRRAVRSNDKLGEYLDYIKDYTIGISWSDLGLLWYKYDRFLMTNNLYGDYPMHDSAQRNLSYGIDFINWCLLNESSDNKSLLNYADCPASIIDE